MTNPDVRVLCWAKHQVSEFRKSTNRLNFSLKNPYYHLRRRCLNCWNLSWRLSGGEKHIGTNQKLLLSVSIDSISSFNCSLAGCIIFLFLMISGGKSLLLSLNLTPGIINVFCFTLSSIEEI